MAQGNKVECEPKLRKEQERKGQETMTYVVNEQTRVAADTDVDELMAALQASRMLPG